MVSRFSSHLWLSLWAFVVFLGYAQAADEVKTKLGNATIDRTVQLRTHSIFAPYIDQDLQNRWWDFGADAYINTNKYIRLTRNKPSEMGWLWSRLPLTASNWVVEVEFKVSGESSHLFGDGMVIWLAKDRAKPGPVMGSVDNFNGLGVFLDTYANTRHPYAFPRIYAILGNGQTSYNHDSDGEEQQLGACSANYRRTNVATKLKITYVKDTFLDVKVQYKAWDDWSDCFFVEGISLPSSPYLGFSAQTGDVSDNHDIIAISTYSAITKSLSKDSQSSSKSRVSVPGISSSSWSGFFFKLFLLIGVCVGGYYGWNEYKRRTARGGFGGGGYQRVLVGMEDLEGFIRIRRGSEVGAVGE
ncbi:hypothetical protein D9758_005926 [Tetrapyrgos nigripes]|uniref:L-type lectin-like domain-containing protein n=1 Tax=Tetrapyrgos nigripes TaxID=182062 RepID=A0A8H5LH87_9AGAR|nr:hypothetical protein D9758_005926 [Tetrapyrgos nigripes]